jgi:hypothetical protein
MLLFAINPRASQFAQRRRFGTWRDRHRTIQAQAGGDDLRERDSGGGVGFHWSMAAKEKAPRGYLRASGNETGGESARVYPGPERARIMIALIMIGLAEIRRMWTAVIGYKYLSVNVERPACRLVLSRPKAHTHTMAPLPYQLFSSRRVQQTLQSKNRTNFCETLQLERPNTGVISNEPIWRISNDALAHPSPNRTAP